MILGTITAKHIVCHPITIISMFGFVGYIKLLAKCMNSTPSCFTDFMMM